MTEPVFDEGFPLSHDLSGASSTVVHEGSEVKARKKGMCPLRC